MKKILTLLFSCFIFYGIALSQNTEYMYLSGKGLGNTKKWDFFCSKGMNSGKWKKINVPSQWELEGFGAYTYGRFYKKKEKASNETGLYKYEFKIPGNWKGKSVNIVFDGVMTDAEVKINGKVAGPVHRGAFYRFKYDITNKINLKGKNKLEVKVWKQSSNKSVNRAERYADWWDFGGIYRPVYLEAFPETHIERIAVDAAADGKLRTELHLKNISKGYYVSTSIALLGNTGNESFSPEQTSLLNGDTVQTVVSKWDGIKTWNCENPNLYVLKISLLDRNRKVLHTVKTRIGFRTVEFKPKDGIYVNGVKVVLKGINRHSFYPEGGRTTNRQISLEDASLLKSMNANAVRSHYPPDVHFLDMCDSIGLFYLDELAGWQNSYDDETGRILLPEMIARDVNHPCIILWDNGNEGGWNYHLDSLFGKYDPQKRHVVHPWADFNDLDAHHYPTYLTGIGRFTNGYRVFMPTEFMHSMYDQGAGAGLDDFWNKYTGNPLFAGGFIWSFADNAVVRTDRKDSLDTDENNAPDGIFGAHREKEGSYYTIREIWSPVQIKKMYITPSFKGDLFVENKYLYTNLGECSMKYHVYTAPSPLVGGKKELIAEGNINLPEINPGETAKAHFDLPDKFFEGDFMTAEAYDKNGEEICNWSWTIKYAGEYFAEQNKKAKEHLKINNNTVSANEKNAKSILSSGNMSVTFENGLITEVKCGEKIIPFINGPVIVGMNAKYKSSYVKKDNNAYYIVKYAGAVDSITWELSPDGLLGMSAVMLDRSRRHSGLDDAFSSTGILNLGFSFDYPEKYAKAMKWFGKGPYRVWKNRIKGTNYNIWHKDYNNTVTGEYIYPLIYPEFKGYHANLYWATIESDKYPFTVYSETDGVFFRVFTPEEPKGRQKGTITMPEFPKGDLSFLLEIPGIRSFKPIPDLGPGSQPGTIRVKSGDEGLKMKLWFDFNPIVENK